jgi:hypothetical protein
MLGHLAVVIPERPGGVQHPEDRPAGNPESENRNRQAYKVLIVRELLI